MYTLVMTRQVLSVYLHKNHLYKISLIQVVFILLC